MHFPPAAHFDIFLQMAWQKGAWGMSSGTKDRPVWSLSSTSQKHWPACPSHPAGGLVGRRRAWYCRCCCEGQRRGRQEVSSAWPLDWIFSSALLNLFIQVGVGQVFSMFSFHLESFLRVRPQVIFSWSICWEQAVWPAQCSDFAFRWRGSRI